MTPYCLNRDELERFLELEERVLREEDTILWHLVEHCRNWNVEIVCLAYLLSKILVKKLNQGVNPRFLLEKLSALSDEMWITIQEFDADFIDYTFREIRQRDLSLEENLVAIQNKLSQYDYS